MAVAASTLQPSNELLNGQGQLEVNFRPSVPENLEHWQVFRDVKQIIRFLNNLKEFSDFSVSYKEEGKDYVVEDEPISNLVPRGLVALEQIFDRHDMSKKKEE